MINHPCLCTRIVFKFKTPENCLLEQLSNSNKNIQFSGTISLSKKLLIGSENKFKEKFA